MPELPEVETIVAQLKKILLGKKVVKVEIFDAIVDGKITQAVPFVIRNVYRRGKAIVLQIGNDKFLLVHLRMTGHFHYVKGSGKRNADNNGGRNYGGRNSEKSERFIVARFHLDDGSFFTHNSIRKFGSIRMMSKAELDKVLSALGPEPLEVGAEGFFKLLVSFPHSMIKPKLMDQHVLAGVGNIYAQEALYFAGIAPQRKIHTISAEEAAKLHGELQKILKLAISRKGSTVSNYSHFGGSGDYQEHLAIYQKIYCPKGHKVSLITVGSRRTSYCHECQK